MKPDRVTLAMGAGGRLSAELIEQVFLPAYGNKVLNQLDDAAEFDVDGMRLAFTTDSYTVKPVFFPGGDIGKLAVCGTVNDLAVKGAKPVALSAGFIIEEGFAMEELRRIVCSMQETASSLNIPIVTGDTKVVGRGEADGLFINTAGLGTIRPGFDVRCTRAQKGDAVIVTGDIGRHGMAILNARERLGFSPAIESDVAPVCDIVEKAAAFGGHIHVMRDPTRGGVACVVNEIAKASRMTVTLYETRIPLRPETVACCELLGMDPLYSANEGKIVLFVAEEAAEKVLTAIKATEAGREAAVIGRVGDSPYAEEMPPVTLETAMDTRRFVPLLEGEMLPRIC